MIKQPQTVYVPCGINNATHYLEGHTVVPLREQTVYFYTPEEHARVEKIWQAMAIYMESQDTARRILLEALR